MPVTLKLEPVPMVAAELVPVEKSLDPGEAIVPSDTVDVMAAIVALNETFKVPDGATKETDSTAGTLVIGAILVYFVIKLIFRFLPWILGITAVIILLKMAGNA